MGVLILITKPARRVSNRRRGERTLTTGCAAPPPADRGEGPDGKGKSPAENDPRCEDPRRTPTPTPGSDKCAVVCRHRRLHALCSLWFTRRGGGRLNSIDVICKGHHAPWFIPRSRCLLPAWLPGATGATGAARRAAAAEGRVSWRSSSRKRPRIPSMPIIVVGMTPP